MFDKIILDLEREVRDLRTAHTRGLGMMNFSTMSATATGTPDLSYNIEVKFKNSDTFPPLCQLFCDEISGNFYMGEWDDDTLTFSVWYLHSNSYTYPTITVVASDEIDSISITPAQE